MAPSEPTRSASDFDARALAKRLLRETRAGMLATREAQGAPFASLVNVANDPAGAPLLLVSQLAGHTKHIQEDGRCALLLCATGKGDPLAHPRLTVTGTAVRAADEIQRAAFRARFLARHPKSALYADFADFSFWRIEAEAFHLNGGFARAAILAPSEVLTDCAGSGALMDAEADALAHLNGEHKDALRHLAARFGGATRGEGHDQWRATGIDPEGLDLAAGERTARVAFAERVLEPLRLRAVLAEMTRAARAQGDLSDPV